MRSRVGVVFLRLGNTALSFEKEERQQMETYSKYLSSHRDYTITFAPNSKN